MERITHLKITKLILELRSWDDSVQIEDRPSMQTLADRFDLPIEVIRQVAEAEGIDVRWVDPNASTLDLDIDEIENAVLMPDSDLSYRDEDTGKWKVLK